MLRLVTECDCMHLIRIHGAKRDFHHAAAAATAATGAARLGDLERQTVQGDELVEAHAPMGGADC